MSWLMQSASWIKLRFDSGAGPYRQHRVCLTDMTRQGANMSLLIGRVDLHGLSDVVTDDFLKSLNTRKE